MADTPERLRVHIQDVNNEVARTRENDADDLPLPITRTLIQEK